MPDSSPKSGEIKRGGGSPESQQRCCDFCGESIALLYCRADAAKLCLSCDKQVHSTNQLFTKHARSLLCDSCHESPSSIFCSTDSSVFCQNCDWETHNSSPAHDRRPVEGFTGCPSVVELLGVFGFEDLSKKGLVGGGDSRVALHAGSDSGGDDGFSDYLVWETTSFVSLDDLIASSGSEHNFQAMGVPPLPKNRNAACGAHKDELLHQLREMAKLEPNSDDNGQEAVKPLIEFQFLANEQNTKAEDMFAGFDEGNQEQSLYTSYEDLQANAFNWCCDSGDFGDQEFASTHLGNYNEASCVVPERDSNIVHSPNHENVGYGAQSLHNTAIAETLRAFPMVPTREINSQERDSALSRYKEKKKSRRYDKHIRYESRKVRAESRTRIRGRFAKIEQ